jgi:hypothetical protein
MLLALIEDCMRSDASAFEGRRDRLSYCLHVWLLSIVGALTAPTLSVGRWTDSSRRVAATMSEDLTNKIVAWANEIASYVAQLPSRHARGEYLADRRRELVAGAQR